MTITTKNYEKLRCNEFLNLYIIPSYKMSIDISQVFNLKRRKQKAMQFTR